MILQVSHMLHVWNAIYTYIYHHKFHLVGVWVSTHLKKNASSTWIISPSRIGVKISKQIFELPSPRYGKCKVTFQTFLAFFWGYVESCQKILLAAQITLSWGDQAVVVGFASSHVDPKSAEVFRLVVNTLRLVNTPSRAPFFLWIPLGW